MQGLKKVSYWCQSGCPVKSIFAWTRNDLGQTNGYQTSLVNNPHGLKVCAENH